MKIAFVDPLGLPYNGNTLKHRGLGGSESAIINMADELSKIGFEVTVFNNCDIDGESSGTFTSVIYKPIKVCQEEKIEYDVVIVSRSVKPFLENWSITNHSKYYAL